MLFDTLSKKLDIPLVQFSNVVNDEAESYTKGIYGVVINNASFRGLWSRLVFLFFRRTAINTRITQLKKKGVDISAVLSVYPDVENPLIVFNQAAKAERYCHDNVLPKIDRSVKGLVKQVLFLCGKMHPSVDSFILITGNTDKFQQINTMLIEAGLDAQQDLLCITTSNPVFLSFSKNAVPDYVVHHAESGDFELRQEIHQTLTSFVSTPLAKIKKDQEYYFVESGLPGKPWFQLLKDNSISMGDIKQRALTTLKEFDKKIQTNSNWINSIDVIAEFTRQFEQSHSIRQFDQAVVDACAELVNSLPEKYLVQGTWQHGDYCINNLIFSEEQTYIIDFEEFGDTLMPLQDIFSLALSFYIQRETQTLDLLAKDLTYCLQYTDQKFNPLLPMLFVYHLLFRLGKWGENPNRRFICEWLQNILIEFNKNPLLLFSNDLVD
tara:strand:- start:15590 stop:16900 length:1311 start_codon:yes stop_codon:yes gene_type:complete